ncbi:holo-ACP synthase [Caenimonas aquaedulcis]|uniref:Holo-[acyl-carrier-protein] synthase n=1 Tax=Caenimonas aquaedulcis TaxID=2793270 RepID=A0A931H7F1_9BURK|nr:holo-ACP synthase [Caenimonas aquaedulcis]MBG9390069.1 holo-ACP synthase [Caenimonas aquaedulcis]
MFELQTDDAAWSGSLDNARLGFDLCQVSQVTQSLACFGDRYEERLFTPAERAYALRGGSGRADRLAARFAAKEAVIKALRLPEAGVAFTDIEVVKLDDGDCRIALHGRVADIARAQGVDRVLLSMSHDGDYAGAFVSVIYKQPQETMA